MVVENNTTNITLKQLRAAYLIGLDVIGHCGFRFDPRTRFVVDNKIPAHKGNWSGVATWTSGVIELHFAEEMMANLSTKRILGTTRKHIPLYSKEAVVVAAVCHEMAHIAVRGVKHDMVRAIEAEGVLRQIQKDELSEWHTIVLTWVREKLRRQL